MGDVAADAALAEATALGKTLATLAAKIEAAKLELPALKGTYDSATVATALAQLAYDTAFADPNTVPAALAALKADLASKAGAEAILKMQYELAAAGLASDEAAALTAQADYNAAKLEAEALAAEAERLLEVAANKEITPDVRAALDKMLAGKIQIPAPVVDPVAPL